MKYCMKWQRIWNTYKYIWDQNSIIILSLDDDGAGDGAKAILLLLLLLFLSYFWCLFYCGWRREYHQSMATPFLPFSGPSWKVVNLKEQMKWTKFIVAIYMRSFEENVDSTKSFTTEMFVFSIFQRIILHLNRIVWDKDRTTLLSCSSLKPNTTRSVLWHTHITHSSNVYLVILFSGVQAIFVIWLMRIHGALG